MAAAHLLMWTVFNQVNEKWSRQRRRESFWTVPAATAHPAPLKHTSILVLEAVSKQFSVLVQILKHMCREIQFGSGKTHLIWRHSSFLFAYFQKEQNMARCMYFILFKQAKTRTILSWPWNLQVKLGSQWFKLRRLHIYNVPTSETWRWRGATAKPNPRRWGFIGCFLIHQFTYHFEWWCLNGGFKLKQEGEKWQPQPFYKTLITDSSFHDVMWNHTYFVTCSNTE